MYCPICNLKVAPNDPTRQKMGKVVLHGRCMVKQIRDNVIDKGREMEDKVQRDFGFKEVVRIH